MQGNADMLASVNIGALDYEWVGGWVGGWVGAVLGSTVLEAALPAITPCCRSCDSPPSIML